MRERNEIRKEINRRTRTSRFSLYDRLCLLTFFTAILLCSALHRNPIRTATENLQCIRKRVWIERMCIVQGNSKSTDRRWQTVKQIEIETKHRKILNMMFACTEVAIKANVNLNMYINSSSPLPSHLVSVWFAHFFLAATTLQAAMQSTENTSNGKSVCESENGEIEYNPGIRSRSGLAEIHFSVFDERIILSAPFAALCG